MPIRIYVFPSVDVRRIASAAAWTAMAFQTTRTFGKIRA